MMNMEQPPTNPVVRYLNITLFFLIVGGVILSIIWHATAATQISLVRSVSGSLQCTSCTTNALAQFTANSAGDTILVTAILDNNTSSTVAVSDTNGNSYVLDHVLAVNGFPDYTFRASNIAGSATANTITVSASTSASFFTVLASEWTGIRSSTPLDVLASSSCNGSGTSASPACSLFPTVVGELIYGYGQGDNTIGPASGYSTATISSPVTGDITIYKAATTTASQQVLFAQTSAAWVVDAFGYLPIDGSTPNPGHPWTDIGNGLWQASSSQSQLRTYVFPDTDGEVLTASSSVTFIQRTVTGDTTLSATSDAIVYVDATGGPITITLPSASGTNNGLMFIVKKIDSALANLVTINPLGTQTIDSLTSVSFANRGEAAMFQSDGTIWRVVMRRDYDLNAFHTRGASDPQYYTSPTAGTALTTGALTANRMYAIPLIITKGTTIDQMAVNFTAGSTTGTAEIGIYNDDGNGYPGSLFVDCGSVNTSTGTVTCASNLPVSMDTGLYWMVLDGSNGVTVRSFAVGSLIPILGTSSTLPATGSFGWSVVFTKGALTSTFPSGAGVITAVPIPAVFVRFSG